MNTFARTFGGLLALGLALPWALPAWGANTTDVLVLYTDEARNSRNGQDIDARIASYIAYSNQAYRNSNVDLELRLVGKSALDRNYTYVTEANLDSLRTDSEVLALRRSTGADLVVLLNLAEEVSGGYVCGIGYIPNGDPNAGLLHRNAGSVAFSLVGIDCGLSTFTHEVGHNMGLGHSMRQNSNGGVWAWGRGYGVDGVFSTVMAYPQSFGTRNQLQRLSNPALFNCGGLTCGVDRNRSDGADAAGNITALATQISAFMPTVTSVGGSETPTTGTTGPQPCAAPTVPNNIIVNGTIASTQNWSDTFRLSTLQREQISGECIKDVLAVTKRTAYYSSAFQSLAGKLVPNTRYRLNAEIGVRGTSRATIRVALQLNTNGVTSYSYLSNVSATANDFTAYQQEFVVNSNNITGLVIYGPSAGIDILLDNVSLVAVPAQSAAEAAALTGAVLQEDFEQQANGWGAFNGGKLVFTEADHGYSLLSTARANRHAGPMLDVAGVFEEDATYELSLRARIGGEVAEPVQVWFYFEDDQGPHWQKIAEQQVSANQWQDLAGAIHLRPTGAITHARLHVAGPAAGTDIEIDDLVVNQTY